METFHLGFQLDSTPLKTAGQEAAKAAEAVSKLGDAEQKLQKDAAAAAAAQEKLGKEYKKTGEEAEKTGEKTKKSIPPEAPQKAQEFAAALQRAQGAMAEAMQAAGGLSGALGAGGGGGGLGGAMNTVLGAFGRFGGMLGPTGLIIGAITAGVGFLGKQVFDTAAGLAKAADDMALMEGRFKNALGSIGAARESMRAIYETTQQTGLGFQSASESFNRLARNAEALGASRQQILQLSETIQKLGAVSGASRGEIASGMIQLSQALASGRLNGDELRSIMENMPALAKAIADGLGVSVGQIRAMGAAGELTGSKVFDAILKSSAKANQEFATLPDTVERANQRVADSWDQLLAQLGKAWNASDLVRNSTNWLNRLINGAQRALQDSTLGEQIYALEARLARQRMLPGRDSQIAQRGIEEQLRILREQAQTQLAADIKAREETDVAQSLAPIKRAAETGANQFDDFQKKVKTAREGVETLEGALERIRIRQQTGLATEEERALIPSLTRQLGIAKAELGDLIIGVDRLKRDLSDSRIAALTGGGGGGTGIVQRAIQQRRDAAGKGGGGSLQDFINVGVQQAVEGASGRIATVTSQTETQRALTAALGGTREALMEVEIATAAAQMRFDLFGKLKGPLIEDFINRYVAALRAQKIALEENAVAQAKLNSEFAVATTRASMLGGYAGREAAVFLRAGRNDNRNPQGTINEFFASEEASVEARVRQLSQSTALTRAGIGSFANQRQRELAILEERISQEGLNVAPGQRDRIAQGMRDDDRARFDAARDAEERSLSRQLQLQQQRYSTLGLYGQELRVQEAILQKHNQLMEAGVEIGSEQYERQIAMTRELANQQFQYDRVRDRVQAIRGAVDSAAADFKNVFTSAFEETFTNGPKAGLQSFARSFSGMIRKLGAEMIYEISYRPLVEMTKNLVQSGLSRFLGNIGLSFGGGSPAPLQGNFPAGPTMAANGMAFGHGGVQAFAMGGVVNSPTLFAFANGGRLGLMGEAGPEAILPLSRGSNGKLGVQAAGSGDVTVVVNDMRSSAGSAPVETRSQRSPDGRRMISVMVRDEVRRQMRNGELDRDMQTNFGNTRQIARL